MIVMLVEIVNGSSKKYEIPLISCIRTFKGATTTTSRLSSKIDGSIHIVLVRHNRAYLAYSSMNIRAHKYAHHFRINIKM